MISTSSGYKTEVWQNDNRQFLHYAVVTLTDETVINLDNTNIWQGGFRLEEAVSSSSAMEVGACIASELTLIINNIDGTYDGTDFEGATVVASIGLMINGTEERFQRGVYFVDEMEYTGNLITLTCLDAMVKFDKDYSLSSLTYPATLMQIVSDVCSVCGVTLVANDFPNSSYIVQERPDTDTLTCREVLSCALQIGCSYGRINPLGQLEIGRLIYPTLTWAEAADYTWADLADVEWNESPIAYPDCEITGYSSFKVDFRECVFTGVEVTVDDNSSLVGNDTYTVSVENNVLVSSPSAVASLMYPYIQGFAFWPYEADHLSDPSIQAGDCVLIKDNKGNEYLTFATSITYSAGNYETTGCYAQSYPRNESNRYSPAAVAEARASKAASKYVDLLANSFGLYRSEIPDPVLEGAFTFALHNAPEYDNSTFAMVANAEGLYVQTRSSASDTWTTTASVASNGDALVNVLSAVGIDADWITSGTLTLGGVNNRRGQLKVLDANGNLYGQWDNNGIRSWNSAGATLLIQGGNMWLYQENGTTRMVLQPGGMRSYYIDAQTWSLLDTTITSGGTTYYGGWLHGIDFLTVGKEATEASLTFGTDDSVSIRASGDGSFRVAGNLLLSSIDNAYIQIHSTGDIGLNAKSGKLIFASQIYNMTYSNVSANVWVASTGGLYRVPSSSRRYKHDISELKDFDPHDLYEIDAKQYVYNEGYLSEGDPNIGKPMIGFIAEEVEEAAPWAVQYEDGEPEMWNINAMFPAVFQLVKEQHEEIEGLKKQISDLEERLKALEDGR